MARPHEDDLGKGGIPGCRYPDSPAEAQAPRHQAELQEEVVLRVTSPQGRPTHVVRELHGELHGPELPSDADPQDIRRQIVPEVQGRGPLRKPGSVVMRPVIVNLPGFHGLFHDGSAGR